MTETKKYRMLRIKPDTHRDLRLVAALTGESMIDLIERLVREELAKKLGVSQTAVLEIAIRKFAEKENLK